jgi:hypothetical protein
LKLFPLIHEIADLPHERLVAIDDWLGGRAVIIEARRGHRLLQLPDRSLTFRDARLEIVDAGAMRLLFALPLAYLSIGPLLLFARRRRFRWAWLNRLQLSALRSALSLSFSGLACPSYLTHQPHPTYRLY